MTANQFIGKHRLSFVGGTAEMSRKILEGGMMMHHGYYKETGSGVANVGPDNDDRKDSGVGKKNTGAARGKDVIHARLVESVDVGVSMRSMCLWREAPATTDVVPQNPAPARRTHVICGCSDGSIRVIKDWEPISTSGASEGQQSPFLRGGGLGGRKLSRVHNVTLLGHTQGPVLTMQVVAKHYLLVASNVELRVFDLRIVRDALLDRDPAETPVSGVNSPAAANLVLSSKDTQNSSSKRTSEGGGSSPMRRERRANSAKRACLFCFKFNPLQGQLYSILEAAKYDEDPHQDDLAEADEDTSPSMTHGAAVAMSGGKTASALAR